MIAFLMTVQTLPYTADSIFPVPPEGIRDFPVR